MDNLSTHTASALCETFVPAEVGVMVAQCLDRRIPTVAMRVREVKAWQQAREDV